MKKYLTQMAAEFRANSLRWFPSVHRERTITAKENACLHFAIGAAGEVGEILNKTKKWFSYGDQTGTSGEDKARAFELYRGQMADEIPDALTYLLDLAAELKIDVDQALIDKVGICFGRWEEGYTWQTVPEGHYVPGSGRIISKTWASNGVLYINFDREEGTVMDNWNCGVNPDQSVPVALTSRGLIYPSKFKDAS